MHYRLGKDALLAAGGVVILADTALQGALPLKLGAELPPGLERVPIKTIGIGVVPRMWATPADGPWGVGMPYDGSDAGIQRKLAAHASQRELYREAGAEAQTRMVLELLGCTRTVESLFEGTRRRLWARWRIRLWTHRLCATIRRCR